VQWNKSHVGLRWLGGVARLMEKGGKGNETSCVVVLEDDVLPAGLLIFALSS
jgi:hypothetical protein